ncbi:hypothetical protein AB0J52_25360 [Spirillospora sp. NPDC049652]
MREQASLRATRAPGPALPPEDFPLTVKGRVAQVYGIPAYVDHGWMTSRFASLLVGVTSVTLHRWAAEGVVSFRQEYPGGPIRFLRRELLVVVGMRGDDDIPLSSRSIKRRLTGLVPTHE